MNLIKNFLNDESGATAIEYSLIAAIMAAILILAVNQLGEDLKTAFKNIGDTLKSAGK